MEIDFIQLLLNQGVLGLVCGWFMFRMEKKLDKIADALQREK